ncbi:class I SAM-dependent DNA methyltransferase [Ensifer soli]|uniref:class I SAM-dependent DNA methyltransferase n=1 Tax=Ciceribacter sp. sgz301302 TaxID=3342379 RepID=UPI0035B89B0C
MVADPLSSGDLIADRRAGYARMLAEGGEAEAAADLMRQALEIVPSWAAGWFELAGYEERAGHPGQAADALRRTLLLQPDDIFGAGLKLARLGVADAPATPPSAYVARLFDDYARRFDAALTERLAYSVPETLAALVLRERDGATFPLAVDLGCGTGLFGARVRPHVGRLEGFDLSAGMLAEARAKDLYDLLAEADLSLPPGDSGLFSGALARHRADLVSAADVLMYLGDLKAAFAIVAALVAPHGRFAFSVEDAGAEGDVVLRPSLRYAHSEAYLRAMCDGHGLDIVAVERSVIRMDAGAPVHGLLCLAAARG